MSYCIWIFEPVWSVRRSGFDGDVVRQVEQKLRRPRDEEREAAEGGVDLAVEVRRRHHQTEAKPFFCKFLNRRRRLTNGFSH